MGIGTSTTEIVPRPGTAKKTTISSNLVILMNKLCIVLAHGGARETVLRHLPFWAKVSDRVIVCSPSDDPLTLGNDWCFVNGKSSRYDAETNLRTRQALALAVEIGATHTIWCEYDALLWRFPEEAMKMDSNSVMGSVFQSNDRKFHGKFYLHSPIIFGRQALSRTTVEMFKLPPGAEHGFGDRYFGYAIELAKVNVLDGHKLNLSYSQNHIEANNRKFMVDAIAAMKRGIAFTHGIKDANVLRQMAQAGGLMH